MRLRVQISNNCRLNSVGVMCLVKCYAILLSLGIVSLMYVIYKVLASCVLNRNLNISWLAHRKSK